MATSAAAAAAGGAPPAVPSAVESAAEDTLAATESVGDHLAELIAAAAEDPDAIAALPPLRRARAFLAMAQAAASLFAGSSRFDSLPLWLLRLRCSGVDPDEHPIKKEFERLSLWEEKLNRFEDWDKAPLRPTTTVNTQAAARFIGHSLSHLTADQKRSMQAISRGEGGSYSGNKRKPHQPLPKKKSVRAATEEFLAKATLELSGHNNSKVKGPIRLISDEDED
uniref:Nuclear nucleic acid-binding protein C1D n=1 Tax=Leersia perrieri TaxID=77586 RepID=A0A0D9X645_9ORYZ